METSFLGIIWLAYAIENKEKSYFTENCDLNAKAEQQGQMHNTKI